MVESNQAVSVEDVARHYDQLDRFYREIWGEHVHHGLWRSGRESAEEAVLAMSCLVAEKARIGPGMAVCDVGCGYGGTSRILASNYGAKVTGLTVSPMQHRFAAASSEIVGNPVFLLENWMENQRPGSSFDALIAIESTEHMQDKCRVFTEAARVLVSGGRLVVCAWLAGDALKSWHHRHLIEPVCREGRLPAMGTEKEYVDWMSKAGFVSIEREDVSKNVSRTWPLCAWRFVKGVVRRPGYLRFLLDSANDNRIFAITMVRIWLAYRLGAMRYVVFSAVKGQANG